MRTSTEYRQAFSVRFEYPVVFTRNVFAASNPVLERVMTEPPASPLTRLLALIDTLNLDDVAALASITEKTSASANPKLMEYASKINRNSFLWLVFDAKDALSGFSQKQNPDGKEAKKGMQQLFPIDNIQGGFLSFNLTGQNKENLNIEAHVTCKEKSKAQLLAIQLQAMVLTYIPVIAQDNKQLNDALSDAVKFSNEGNDIVVKLDFSSELQDQLKNSVTNAIANPFQNQLAAKRKKGSKTENPDSSNAGVGAPTSQR